MLLRRTFLKHIASALTATLLPLAATHADAKDGGHDDGHDGHEGDGHSGHDDNGGDNGGDDGGEGDGHGKGKNNGALGPDEALREMESGRIIPLKRALRIADGRLSGKVIDISLIRSFGRPQYRIKVRDPNGAVSTIRIDARTGDFVGIFGF